MGVVAVWTARRPRTLLRMRAGGAVEVRGGSWLGRLRGSGRGRVPLGKRGTSLLECISVEPRLPDRATPGRRLEDLGDPPRIPGAGRVVHRGWGWLTVW